MKRPIITNISLILGLLLPWYATARSVHIFDELNNSFSANASFAYLNYREHPQEINPDAPGDVTDIGLTYGLAINTRNLFFTKIYTDLTLEYVAGKIKYDGYEQSPSYTVIKRKMMQSMINIDTKLGLILLDNNYLQLIPYGGLGFRHWQQATHLSYQHFKALAGVRLNCFLSENFSLSPFASIGTTLRPRAKNTVLPVTFHMGTKAIYEAGLELNYRLDDEIFLTSSASYTSFRYGQDINTHPTYKEPNSKTQEIRFSIGIKYSFI